MDIDTIARILLIGFGIGAIIFVHELGHFLVAKAARVRVEGFSLGFPPTGVGFKRSVEGLRVTLLPNFFYFHPLEVGGLERGSPADLAGLSLGDKILAVNDQPAERLTYDGLERLLRDEWAAGKAAAFLVERDGSRLTVGPVERPEQADLPGFGLFPHLAWQQRHIGSGDTWAYGLAAGERVSAVGTQPMVDREAFKNFCGEAAARGTGIVRFHIQSGEVPPDDGAPPSREIKLLIQLPQKKPSKVFLLPILKGIPGQTEYRLSLIPVGGYVKMAGDAPGEGKGESDEFLQKGVGARAAIIAAGSLTNIVFAFFIFILAFQVGVQFYSPVVGDCEEASPAFKGGLRRGDRVLSIDGSTVAGFMDIATEVAFSDPDGGALFEVERDIQGEKKRMEFKVLPVEDKEGGRLTVGIRPFLSSRIQSLNLEGALYLAGVRVKDRIVELNGKEVDDKLSLSQAVETLNSGKPFTIIVERDGKLLDPISCTAPTVKVRYQIGITPSMYFQVKTVGGGIAPLKDGDQIVSVNNSPIQTKDFTDTVVEILGDGVRGKVTLGVKRDGGEVKLTRMFENRDDLDNFVKQAGLRCFARVDKIDKSSEFHKLGLAPGIILTQVNGSEFTSLQSLQKLIQASKGESIAVSWLDGAKPEKTEKIRPLEISHLQAGDLGIVQLSPTVEKVKLSLGQSIEVGIKRSFKFAKQVFQMLAGIFTKKLSPKNLGGPILIVTASFHFAEQGFGKLLFFFAILGVNLGIINLFPIPILDGGHLVFLAIEKIKGSPVSEPVQIYAQYAGLLILLVLMVYVTFQDVLRLTG